MITKIINLFGGPGSGKSTTALGLTYLMKLQGMEAEYVSEYAKDLVWEGRLKDTPQWRLHREQAKRIERLQGKVEWVVTDSPTILSLIYSRPPASPAFARQVWNTYHKYPGVNIFINRVKPYSRVGRGQTERQARAIDLKIRKFMLASWSVNLFEIDGDENAAPLILEALNDVCERLGFNT